MEIFDKSDSVKKAKQKDIIIAPAFSLENSKASFKQFLIVEFNRNKRDRHRADTLYALMERSFRLSRWEVYCRQNKMGFT